MSCSVSCSRSSRRSHGCLVDKTENRSLWFNLDFWLEDFVPIFDPDVRFNPAATRLYRVTDTGTFERVRRPQGSNVR